MNTEHLSMIELENFDSGSPNRGKERRFACPLCGRNKPIDAPHRSLAVNTENGSFYCHRCQTKGRLREFWDETRLIIPKKQKTRLKVMSQFSINETNNKKVEKEKIENLAEKMEKYQNEFLNSPAEFYLLNRGIPINIATKAGCGYAGTWEHWEKTADTWKLQGQDKRVVFPISDQNGKVIAIHGRAIDDHHLASSKITRGDKSQGLFLSDADVLDNGVIAVCEGAIDAMALAACGIGAVAMTGTTPPDWFYRKMSFKRVLLATDADEAGDKAAFRLKTGLSSRGAKVIRLRPKGAKDWGEVLENIGENQLSQNLSAFKEKLSDGERIRQVNKLLEHGRTELAEFAIGLIKDGEIRENFRFQRLCLEN